jgi:hypothetical protein
MKVPASHIKHMKDKRKFNESKAYLETKREMNRHAARKRKQ